MVRRMFGVMVMVVAVSLCSPALADVYVRGDGSGSGGNGGTAWGDAYATVQQAIDSLSLGSEVGTVTETINVQSSSGAETYAPSGRTGSIQVPFEITFAGGWTDVDGTPTQDGVSLITGSGLGGADIGLNFNKTSGDHSEYMRFNVESFDIVDVSVGAQIKAGSGYDSVRPVITLDDCEVTAGTHGVEIDWAKNYGNHGPSTITLTDTAVTAGLSAAGHGLTTNGPQPQVTIQSGSSVTSAAGHGVLVVSQSASAVTGTDKFFVKVLDSKISDSSGDGIHYEDPDSGAYYSGVVDIVLDKAVISGNGGDGVYVRTWNEGDWTGGNNTAEIHLDAENSLIVANGGNGLYLIGRSDTRTDTAQVEVLMVNCTVADNTLDGLHTETDHDTGGPHVIQNTILAFNGGDGVDVDDGDAAGMTLTEVFNNLFSNGGSAILVHGLVVGTDGSDFLFDPSFWGAVDPYRLNYDSLLVDAASALYAPADDIDGVLRPVGAGDAVGAYEVAGPVAEPAGLGLMGLALLGLKKKRS
jgi:hypothetical protein